MLARVCLISRPGEAEQDHVLRFLTLPLLSNRTLLIGLSPKYLGFIFLPWFCPSQQLLRLILK